MHIPGAALAAMFFGSSCSFSSSAIESSSSSIRASAFFALSEDGDVGVGRSIRNETLKLCAIFSPFLWVMKFQVNIPDNSHLYPSNLAMRYIHKDPVFGLPITTPTLPPLRPPYSKKKKKNTLYIK